nr:hypothetical protein [Tanacetum cinerariifolium]
ANCASFVLGWMMEGRGSSGLWWRSSRKRGKWSCSNGEKSGAGEQEQCRFKTWEG